ncbi:MAG: hypothetical protein ACE5DM_03445 [Candidatus Nanoarchaeia archaeon]
MSIKVIIPPKLRRKQLVRFRQLLKKPEYRICREALSAYLLGEEIDAFDHLGISQIERGELAIFYPGCGLDLAMPLLYMKKLGQDAKVINMILADKEIFLEDFTAMMVAFTGNQNYSLDKRRGCVTFRFRDQYVRLICRSIDLMSGLPSELKEGYDVYLERAFEPFRRENRGFLARAFSTLNREGIVIIDAGLDKDLSRGFRRLDVSKKVDALGFYPYLSFYQK